MKNILFISAFLLTATGSAYAESADPRSIMQRVSDRDDGHASYTRSVIATCRYQVTAGKMGCAEKPRLALARYLATLQVE